MQIQINSDNSIDGSSEFSRHVEGLVAEKFSRFAGRISRMEVHFSDENGQKRGGEDQRCMLEARVEGRQPMAVSHQASTIDLAFNGAVEKLKNVLETSFGRIKDRRR